MGRDLTGPMRDPVSVQSATLSLGMRCQRLGTKAPGGGEGSNPAVCARAPSTPREKFKQPDLRRLRGLQELLVRPKPPPTPGFPQPARQAGSRLPFCVLLARVAGKGVTSVFRRSWGGGAPMLVLHGRAPGCSPTGPDQPRTWSDPDSPGRGPSTQAAAVHQGQAWGGPSRPAGRRGPPRSARGSRGGREGRAQTREAGPVRPRPGAAGATCLSDHARAGRLRRASLTHRAAMIVSRAPRTHALRMRVTPSARPLAGISQFAETPYKLAPTVSQSSSASSLADVKRDQ